VNQAFSSKQTLLDAAGVWSKRLTHEPREWFWHSAQRNRAKVLAIVGNEGTMFGTA